MSYRVLVCDDCGDQYAPESAGEVCGCLDREGARHLSEIEVVPATADDAGIERGMRALAATDSDYRYVSDTDLRAAVESVLRAVGQAA